MSGPVSGPAPVPPDTKDWTWVLDRPCEECGYDASTVSVADLPHLIRANAVVWLGLMGVPEVAERPRPDGHVGLAHQGQPHDGVGTDAMGQVGDRHGRGVVAALRARLVEHPGPVLGVGRDGHRTARGRHGGILSGVRTR
jgi:hypothetical protein